MAIIKVSKQPSYASAQDVQHALLPSGRNISFIYNVTQQHGFVMTMLNNSLVYAVTTDCSLAYAVPANSCIAHVVTTALLRCILTYR